MLAQVIRETGFKKAEDFYIALGSGKLQTGVIVKKVLTRLKTAEVAEEEGGPAQAEDADDPEHGSRDHRQWARRRPRAARQVLHAGAERRDRRLHLARQGDHDPPQGLPEREDADAQPRALHRGRVGRRLDEELLRPDRGRRVGPAAAARGRRPDLAEHGANIVSYGGTVEDQLAKNWYTAELGDVKALRTLLTSLRNVEAVFDAYRVTPS